MKYRLTQLESDRELVAQSRVRARYLFIATVLRADPAVLERLRIGPYEELRTLHEAHYAKNWEQLEGSGPDEQLQAAVDAWLESMGLPLERGFQRPVIALMAYNNRERHRLRPFREPFDVPLPGDPSWGEVERWFIGRAGEWRGPTIGLDFAVSAMHVDEDSDSYIAPHWWAFEWAVGRADGPPYDPTVETRGQARERFESTFRRKLNAYLDAVEEQAKHEAFGRSPRAPGSKTAQDATELEVYLWLYQRIMKRWTYPQIADAAETFEDRVRKAVVRLAEVIGLTGQIT